MWELLWFLLWLAIIVGAYIKAVEFIYKNLFNSSWLMPLVISIIFTIPIFIIWIIGSVFTLKKT